MTSALRAAREHAEQHALADARAGHDAHALALAAASGTHPATGIPSTSGRAMRRRVIAGGGGAWSTAVCCSAAPAAVDGAHRRVDHAPQQRLTHRNLARRSIAARPRSPRRCRRRRRTASAAPGSARSPPPRRRSAVPPASLDLARGPDRHRGQRRFDDDPRCARHLARDAVGHARRTPSAGLGRPAIPASRARVDLACAPGHHSQELRRSRPLAGLRGIARLPRPARASGCAAPLPGASPRAHRPCPARRRRCSHRATASRRGGSPRARRHAGQRPAVARRLDAGGVARGAGAPGSCATHRAAPPPSEPARSAPPGCSRARPR